MLPQGGPRMGDATKAWSRPNRASPQRVPTRELAEILFLDAAVLLREAWLCPGATLVGCGSRLWALRRFRSCSRRPPAVRPWLSLVVVAPHS